MEYCVKKLQLISVLGISLCALTACGGKTHHVDQYAPPPPEIEMSELSFAADPDLMIRAQSFSTPTDTALPSEVLALSSSKMLKKCRIKDKFDRKALLAYEWDDGERLSLDVDGIGMDSTEISKVYLQYKISLQPELKKKDPCKYASSYQGIVGSMYNELVIHEGQNLYDEVDFLQNKVGSVLASITE